MLRVILILFTIFSSLAAPALAASAGTGTIQGQLVNGTASGSGVANLEITLKTYLNDKEINSATSQTDEEGNFIFTGVKIELGFKYQASLFFQAGEYTSERFTFAAEEDTASTTVTVFDATTSAESVRIATAHTIIYAGQDTLDVKEYFLFVNDSDRTYVGPAMRPEKTGVLTFLLPPESTGFQLSLGLGIVNTSDGFAESMPLLPGVREVAFNYQIPYRSGEYVFSPEINYPMDNYNVLIQGSEVQVSSTQLVKEETLTISGNQFQHFSGSDLLPRDTIAVRLSGLSGSGGSAFQLFAAGLLVLVFVVSLGYLWMKRRTPHVPVAESSVLSQEELLQEIARLDDTFESGKIRENAYRRQRAENKQKLVKMMTDAEKKV